MTKSEYYDQIRLWLLSLFIFTIAFPYITDAVALLSPCEEFACTELARRSDKAAKTLGILFFTIGIFWTAHRRLKYLGFSSGWSFVLFVWLCCSVGYLISLRNLWTKNVGVIILETPTVAMSLFVGSFLVFIAVVERRPRDTTEQDNSVRFWIIATSIAIYTVVITVPLLMQSLVSVPEISAYVTKTFIPILVALIPLIKLLILWTSVSLALLCVSPIFLYALISLARLNLQHKRTDTQVLAKSDVRESQNISGTIQKKNRTRYNQKMSFGRRK